MLCVEAQCIEDMYCRGREGTTGISSHFSAGWAEAGSPTLARGILLGLTKIVQPNLHLVALGFILHWPGNSARTAARYFSITMFSSYSLTIFSLPLNPIKIRSAGGRSSIIFIFR